MAFVFTILMFTMCFLAANGAPVPDIAPYHYDFRATVTKEERRPRIPFDTSSIPRPSDGNRAAQVYVGVYLESVGNFVPTKMTFDVDLYLRLSWNDHRLRNQTQDEVALEGSKIRSDLHMTGTQYTTMQALRRIWIPDIYFANARESHSQTVTVNNIGGTLFQDGTVALSRRVTLSVACNMDLKNYPLDDQTCYIRINSYANNSSKVNISWFSHEAVDHNPDIHLPELEIITSSAEYCNSDFRYPITEQFVTKSKFSCLHLKLLLRRSVTYHVVQTYVPTALIVIISWVSFWIDPEAVPACVSLSFTTLLTLSTMGAGLRYALPPVSYAKAIDIWYGVCMFFIFAALVEFTVVNSLMRSGKKCFSVAGNLAEKKYLAAECGDEAAEYGVHRTDTASSENSLRTNATTPPLLALSMMPANLRGLYTTGSMDGRRATMHVSIDASDQMAQDFKERAAALHRKARSVDKACRVIFPVAFLIYNFAYWLFYLIL